jgi:hypothetical protein
VVARINSAVANIKMNVSTVQQASSRSPDKGIAKEAAEAREELAAALQTLGATLTTVAGALQLASRRLQAAVERENRATTTYLAALERSLSGQDRPS